MTSRPRRTPPRRASLRVRVLAGSAVAIGPGKADLLDAIRATGSISAAARSMRMSYRRAWLLVQTMNRCFAEPVVTTAKGGAEGGGATVTATGRAVLARYRRLTDDAMTAFLPYLKNGH